MVPGMVSGVSLSQQGTDSGWLSRGETGRPWVFLPIWEGTGSGEWDSREEKAGLIQAVAGKLGVCPDLQI